VGYLLASPIRKIMQNPLKILEPHVRSNMTVMDAGCAMGFFSLPMARLVRPEGRVICLDIQDRMLRVLGKKARKAGLSDWIETRVTREQSLNVEGLAEKIDFALAFAVLHEAADPSMFLSQLRGALRRGGRMLLAEPKGHVKKAEWEKSVALIEDHHFTCLEQLRIRRSHAALFEKK
jgi:2-polyprenyl-3-methyl-5-hydroxy-6-metoxy-1,4-benzoquinol methylase